MVEEFKNSSVGDLESKCDVKWAHYMGHPLNATSQVVETVVYRLLLLLFNLYDFSVHLILG